MKILIIEDEIKIASLLKKGLETEGNQVEMAHSGTDGLSTAESGSFDVIILDIMLPGMNGFEVARSLRRKNNITPIVMLTARDTENDKKESFLAGANAYLVKPVLLSTLLFRIKGLTNPSCDLKTRVFSRAEDSKKIEHDIENTKKIINQADNKESFGKKIRKKESAVANTIANPDIANSQSIKKEAIEISALNKNIMDHAPMSIITINKDGYVTSANKFFKKISKTQNFINHNIFTSKFFIKEGLVDDYRKLLTEGTPIRREHCHEKNSKDEDIYLKIIATPIRNKDGKIDGALSMAIDNTEEVVSKNNLINLNNSLELTIKQRTAELYESNEELKKVLKIKSSFAADVSHEMRTSLAIIQGNMELLTRMKAISTDGLESSEQIIQEINRISCMLANLTSLTNADSESQKLNYAKININEIIGSICNSLKVIAGENNISIEHKKNITDLEIVADKAKIEKLMFNLIRNAIKYNKPNGWIRVYAKKTGKKICIKVEDGGIGIPKKHLPFIFERFYRIDSARTRNSGGSGLGLAICKWVAEIHGGSITAISKIGSGSVFTVCLPAIDKK